MTLFGCSGEAESVDDAAEHDMSFSTDDASRSDASHSDASEVSDTDTADTGDSGTSPAQLGGAQPWEDCEGSGATVEAGPDTYRDALAALEPGDTLLLQPGTYTRGLPFRNSGEPERCIVVRPLDPSDRPLFEGSDSFNIVAFHGASWIKVRGLDIDGMGHAGFGVASQGGNDNPTHHVVIEDLSIRGLDSNQQIVGISTKSPAWDWVIRGNRIEGAGTGLYLGNSDGNHPFIRGVIENNTVLDTLGYSMQIKHQNSRPELEGMPTGDNDTIIRWNVFSKNARSSTGSSARPNLLLGHLPTSGTGQDDRYLVYGNFFYGNPTEMLMQVEGNVSVYNNVFVNPNGGAIAVQPHNDVPRQIDIFWNTVVANGRGIRVQGGAPDFRQRVSYNAVFSPMPISADDAPANITASIDEASGYVDSAEGDPDGSLDLRPISMQLGAEVELDALPDVADRMYDFSENLRNATTVGAFTDSAGVQHIPLVLQAR